MGTCLEFLLKKISEGKKKIKWDEGLNYEQ